jgi:hypothetical protein
MSTKPRRTTRTVGNGCVAATRTAGMPPMTGPNIGMSSATPAKIARTIA